MASMASMNWNPFSYLGLAAATYLTWKFTQQAKVYLLPSTLNKRYNASGNNWALVTGATNGIGFGFCEELCERGFNVILHGRNKALLNSGRASSPPRTRHARRRSWCWTWWA